MRGADRREEGRGYALGVDRSTAGSTVIRLEGTIGLRNAEQLSSDLRTLLSSLTANDRLELDLRAAQGADSAMPAIVALLRRRCAARGIPLRVARGGFSAIETGGTDGARSGSIPRPPPPPETADPIQAVGNTVLGWTGEFVELLQFVGRVTIGLLWSFRRPQRIRWGEVAGLVQRTGADALPIVALMSVLIGLVTAFSGAIQLRQFGADIFIANLIGMSMTREMGPLLTAILVTGRSGSAFAAEIGTMKISDEVDALTVMGIRPLDYLVLPRIMAVVITLPLLTLFADLLGILGGMAIAVTNLDLTPLAFLQQLGKSIDLWDVFSGLLKAVVFGILIAGTGCYQGMATRGGALGVGRSTTASVVSGIFLIVLADSIFVVVFHYLGLG